MSYAPPVTLLLILVCVIVFVWEVGHGALASREAIIAAGALSRAEVLRGELWRLGTAMFLHGGPDHLLGNCIALYVVGMACEHGVGHRQMLNLYFLSGLTGSVTSLITSEGPSVGASGAIFGILAAVVVLLYQHRDRFYVRDKRIAVVLAVWAAFIIATGLLSPYVDNGAHLGGALGGWGFGRRLNPTLRDSQTAGDQRIPWR